MINRMRRKVDQDLWDYRIYRIKDARPGFTGLGCAGKFIFLLPKLIDLEILLIRVNLVNPIIRV